ncbi:MAG: aldehyde:ferredoxin oxidoreductase [Thermodesulfovibrionales bacterium]|nr:aldehyde:ferredoxin oxidoreductase [Thermodesulfovibrionales bacterium]
MTAVNELSKVLYIDLSKRHFYTVLRDDLFGKYIGGAGVAIQLLKEECPEGIDPFNPQNPIVFAVGHLTGLFPLASKTVAMFKSPHTGNLGESHAGGRSAISIRSAGYGAIVIKGVSSKPCYISVHENKVYFRDASTLWGMRSSITAGRLIRENEPASGNRTIMRIGLAGEKMIPFACVTTETFRHFGRLGLGAVFGSKKLKALVVSGKKSIPISERKEYLNLYDSIFKTATDSPLMKKYHEIGTPINVMALNASNALPTKNLQLSTFDKAYEISGENIAKGFLGKRLACAHCPVACIHIANLRELYEEEPFFYKTSMIGYDYELIYSVGSMLCISDVNGLLKIIDTVESYGLDCMSTGVSLAWATEAQEKGIISLKDTAGLELKWGDSRCYIEAIKKLIEQPTDFFKALSRGIEYASSLYGGKDFALSFGGNEMPGYHTGPAAHAGCLFGARHSHLDNGGYSFDKKIMLDKNILPQQLADNIVSEEEWRQILSSLVVCFFAREIYKPEVVKEALKVSGFNLTDKDFSDIGKRIYIEKMRFKIREGFSFENLSIPERIYQTDSSVGLIDRKFMDSLVSSLKTKILTYLQTSS